MNSVGNYLASAAAASSSDTDFDLFSRSAFNRYYYAAFLRIRGTLMSLDPAWATPTHQGIPDLLQKTVLKRFKKTVSEAQANGLVDHGEGKRMIHQVERAAAELSNLLTSARETRRLADYEPEVRVIKSGSVTKLGQWTLEAAQHWEQRVATQSNTILKVYARVGLI